MLKSIIMYKTLEIVDKKQGAFYYCVLLWKAFYKNNNIFVYIAQKNRLYFVN